MKLLYAGDPMCSWCYGFGRELQQIIAKSALPVKLIVGGLRAYGTDVFAGAFQRMLFKHWADVQKASGAPFDHDKVAYLTGITYDTEPACRALVTARMIAPDADLMPLFRALQTAFYAEGRNVTDPDVLSSIIADGLSAQGFAITSSDVGLALVSDQARLATREDFAFCQRLGIAGFPTLLIEDGDRLRLLCNGYARSEAILAKIGYFG